MLGGTSEARACAQAVAASGHDVVLSVLTDHGAALAATTVPHRLESGSIAIRQGALDRDGFRSELADCQAFVDAAHPFAVQARDEAWAAAGTLRLRALRLARPGLAATPGATVAATHAEAATLAAGTGDEERSILLTTGTRVLVPYVEASLRAARRLVVRCLPVAESVEACRAAGIPPRDIVCAQGPFSVAFEQALIAECRAGVLVTKESGRAGGLDRKLEACRLAGIPAIVVRRPAEELPATGSVEEVVRWLAA